MTSPSDSGLDPAVRARLERLTGSTGPRRAHPGAPVATDDPPGEADAVPRADAVPETVFAPARLVAAMRLSSRHAWAIALLVLVGLVASSALSLRARAVEVSAPSVVSQPPVQASPAPSPKASVSSVIVHVIGAVARPGVVTVPAPARVRDVIDAAGGLRPDADPGELNLAAVVVDGSQVVVGTVARPRGEVRPGGNAAASGVQPGLGGTGGGGELVDLNTATADQLDRLPGVGPVTTSKILAWRTQHGRFTRVEELQEIDGIGPKTYAEIARHVRV